jgi:hypothetical protein
VSRPDVKWGGLVFTWDDGAYHAALGTGEVTLLPSGADWYASVAAGVDTTATVRVGPDEVTALEAAFRSAMRRHADAIKRIGDVLVLAAAGE